MDLWLSKLFHEKNLNRRKEEEWELLICVGGANRKDHAITILTTQWLNENFWIIQLLFYLLKVEYAKHKLTNNLVAFNIVYPNLFLFLWKLVLFWLT